MASIAARFGVDADVGDRLATASLSLARSFAGGATLWCIAPEWPEHARHVAVEFVHPVVMGKRALPAVSVANEPVRTLRSLVRAGDVVLAVSRSNSQATIEVMRRAQAWGATTIWVGFGQRPADQLADHIIWVDGDTADDQVLAVHDGRLVLLYHVLWELTHVCFEHPGLLAVASGDEGEVCITCSDEGRLGEVLDPGARTRAKVRTAGGIEFIDTMLVDPLTTGDLVLIHAGTAIAVVP